MPGGYDPVADLEQRGDITWLRDDGLPRGDGWWIPWLRLIVTRASLHPSHQRCVLAHELVHVDNGDVQLARRGPDGPRQARRAEARADSEAARRLIDVGSLAAAMVEHPRNPAAVAHALDVTVEVLRTRLEQLPDDERDGLLEALAATDDAA